MAFKSPENVQETTTTTGTGTLTLAGAVSGRFAFSSQLANGDTVFYTITDGTDLESGVGTYTNTSGQQLSRDTVLYSTNGNAKVNWAVGTRNVFAALPGAVVASLLDPGAVNGLLVQTGARTYARRTLQAGGFNLGWTNADGVGGDPQIILDQGPGSGLDADTLDGKHLSEIPNQMLLQGNSGNATAMFTGGGVSTWTSFDGRVVGQATSTIARSPVPNAGTLKRFVVDVQSNTLDASVRVRIYLDGVTATILYVDVPAGVDSRYSIDADVAVTANTDISVVCTSSSSTSGVLDQVSWQAVIEL